MRGHHSPQCDGELIAKARMDAEAFSALYRRNYDAVFRYCVHRLFDRQAAEDVTSAVFLKAVASFDTFTGDEADYRNWLYRIATNTANEHLRKTHRRDRILRNVADRLAGQPAGEASTAAAETTAAVTRAILRLNPRYQAVITLRFFEGMKLTEIAGVVGCSAATARSRLSRALGRLRKILTSTAPLTGERSTKWTPKMTGW